MRSQYNGNEKAESWSHRGRVPSCPLGGRRSPVRKPFPGGSVPAPEQAPSSAPLHVPHTFPIILLKAPCFSFDKHLFIHTQQAPLSRQTTGAAIQSHARSPEDAPSRSQAFVPETSCVWKTIPHSLFLASVFNRENKDSRTVIYRLFFGAALFIYIYHLDTEISTTQPDSTVTTGWVKFDKHCSMLSSA